MKKTVLITGATAGIGYATAIKFATGQYRLILTGRRKDRLKQLKEKLEQEYKSEVTVLEFDIREKDEVDQAMESLSADWHQIDVLVNNAGLASGLASLHDGNSEDWDTMIDTNVKGLLYVSRKVMPWMISRGMGHIINIGSIAGKEVYPRGNVYCATKHAVDALTKAMRMELMEHGIKVTQIEPGAVETEFSLVRFKGDHDRAGKVYQGYTPLIPEDVAESVYYVTTLPERVNINELLIMPTAQANSTTFNKKG